MLHWQCGELQCQLLYQTQRNHRQERKCQAGLHFGCSQNNLLQATSEQELLDLTIHYPPMIVVYTGWVTAMKRGSGVKQEQRDPAGLRHLSAELCHSRLRREVCPQLVLCCGCRDLYYLSMYISRLVASRRIKDWLSTSAPHFVSSLNSKILNQTMWPVHSNSLEICKIRHLIWNCDYTLASGGKSSWKGEKPYTCTTCKPLKGLRCHSDLSVYIARPYIPSARCHAMIWNLSTSSIINALYSQSGGWKPKIRVRQYY